MSATFDCTGPYRFSPINIDLSKRELEGRKLLIVGSGNLEEYCSRPLPGYSTYFPQVEEVFRLFKKEGSIFVLDNHPNIIESLKRDCSDLTSLVRMAYRSLQDISETPDPDTWKGDLSTCKFSLENTDFIESNISPSEWENFAIEVATRAKERYQSMNELNIHVDSRCHDVTKPLPEGIEQVNYIVFTRVFLHLAKEDKEKSLQNLVSVLADGGVLYMDNLHQEDLDAIIQRFNQYSQEFYLEQKALGVGPHHSKERNHYVCSYENTRFILPDGKAIEDYLSYDTSPVLAFTKERKRLP